MGSVAKTGRELADVACTKMQNICWLESKAQRQEKGQYLSHFDAYRGFIWKIPQVTKQLCFTFLRFLDRLFDGFSIPAYYNTKHQTDKFKQMQSANSPFQVRVKQEGIDTCLQLHPTAAISHCKYLQADSLVILLAFLHKTGACVYTDLADVDMTCIATKG